MESKICMNAACRAVTSAEWKKGWDLRSGGFATLCFNCGYAYENMTFCDTFHLEETGWRECSLCKKRLHCGCIASKTLLELLSFGGVGCSGCARSYQPHPIRRSQVSNDIDTSTINNVSNIQSTPITNIVDPDTVSKDTLVQLDSDSVSKEKILQWTPETVTKEKVLQLTADDVGNEKPLQLGSDAVSKENVLQLGLEAVSKEKRPHLGNFMDTNEPGHFPPPSKAERNPSNGKVKQENFMPSIGDMGASFLSLLQPSGLYSKFSKPNNNSPSLGDKDIYELFRQPSMSMALSSSSEAPNFKPSFLSGVVDGKELNKAHSSLQQSQRSRLILPKPSKMAPNVSLDTNKSPSIPVRVARPPGEGRGGNQLLPRYWPRITDEELLLLSAELKSEVVPLFEKVLSASDAGRIGRLVLPKACAEAYFPPIIQSEGLPVRVQDAKGKEWIFQFRFWPNNNSRMYVLEGVTPCIQSMQLEAGDTVTFSRMDPGGKLVIGSRKATGIVDTQDGETSALPNGANLLGEMPFSPANGFTGLFQSPNEYKEPTHSMSYNVTDENVNWPKSEKLPKDISGKKKARNIIGSKSKRLLIDNDDAMELRFTWEEAQDLLRPPPSVKPKIVSIEDHEIEEYDEPPVFGKRTIFTVQASGEQEQWAQCDNCSKWRRLPVDFLIPSKWTCLDNVWDPSRCSCSAPDDISPKEVENLFKPTKSFKKRTTENLNVVQEDRVACGLDALASAAMLGENVSDSADGSIGVTTKHPRHRPGCTCIVCIQPPSGKGKHKRTCTCNVCMSVKRRFETMMNRKRSRQMERDAEVAQKDDAVMIDPSNILLHKVQREMNETETGGNGHIDLNFQPGHREDVRNEANEMSMTAEVTGFPLEKYLKQNRLVGLAACSLSLQQGEQQTEECLPDQLENCFKSPDCKPDIEADADETTHSMQNLGNLD